MVNQELAERDAEIQRLQLELAAANAAQGMANQPVANNTVSNRVVNKPAMFNGYPPDEVPIWCMNIREYLSLMGVGMSESQKVTAAASYLSGVARQWWVTLCLRRE